ncbi:MAG TPA: hypothetical protein VHD61_06870 [Lacunisphaera sp.]|nr:hypothetical protein [Lacunisphaera sp.]
MLTVVAALLFRSAPAQTNTDPFVYLRGGAGDRAMDQLPNHDRGITPGPDHWNLTTGNSNWPDLFFPLETLHVGLLPPTLGEPWPGEGGRLDDGSSTGLDGTSFFVGFALLASRDGLTDGQTKRILAYQRAQQELLAELRAKLAELAGATPAARAAGLSAFAALQAGRLQDLEREEEAIRDDVAWVGPKFGRSLAFRLEGGDAAASPRLLFAANFYAGLSVEQRMLLAEIAHEEQGGEGPAGLETITLPPGALPPWVEARIQKIIAEKQGPEGGPRSREPDGKSPAGDQHTAGTETGSGIIFFQPATARLHLPATLPPELEAKIRRFVAEKQGLKDELRTVVLRDDYVLGSTRTHRLEALAAAEAPRFAALEALAEEIRIGLASLGFPGQPNDLGLPADLTQRVGRFYSRKVEVRRALLNETRTLRRDFPGVRFFIVAQGDGLVIVQMGDNAKAADLVARFNAAAAPHYAEFTRESENLTRAIQEYLEHSPPGRSRTVDQLAADFLRAYRAQGDADRYRDYGRAVLEPGLSSAQRRLLFNAALWPAKPPAAQPQP